MRVGKAGAEANWRFLLCAKKAMSLNKAHRHLVLLWTCCGQVFPFPSRSQKFKFSISWLLNAGNQILETPAYGLMCSPPSSLQPVAKGKLFSPPCTLSFWLNCKYPKALDFESRSCKT